MYSREERKLYQRVYRTRTKYTRADKEAEYQREYAARKRIETNEQKSIPGDNTFPECVAIPGEGNS